LAYLAPVSRSTVPGIRFGSTGNGLIHSPLESMSRVEMNPQQFCGMPYIFAALSARSISSLLGGLMGDLDRSSGGGNINVYYSFIVFSTRLYYKFEGRRDPVTSLVCSKFIEWDRFDLLILLYGVALFDLGDCVFVLNEGIKHCCFDYI
jgi:hypothetical protein